MPLDGTHREIFQEIYATDLTFRPACFQLCGDSHCCNYARYKSKFRFLGQARGTVTPLLPGEFEFLEEQGWLLQFHDYRHNVAQYDLENGVMRVESITSTRHPCACDHATRTTACRLYPLLPVFEVSGELSGVDPVFGIYDELERIDALPRACKIEDLSFDELNRFLFICRMLARSPTIAFYVTAYRLAKHHVREKIGRLVTSDPKSAFNSLEDQLLDGQLFAGRELKHALSLLAKQYQHHYNIPLLS